MTAVPGWGARAEGAGQGGSLTPRPPPWPGLGTHGSGECMGEEAWRMYWVHWNTRKARLARKSRADSRPATGRSWKPVRSAGATGGQGAGAGGGAPAGHTEAVPPRPPAGPHPSGSGRRPPAGGCCPPGTRRIAPAARKPPGAPGRRGWRRGLSGWYKPPSCGQGAQAGRGPPQPRSRALLVGARLCPLQALGSLTHSGCFGGFWGQGRGLGKPLLHPDFVLLEATTLHAGILRSSCPSPTPAPPSRCHRASPGGNLLGCVLHAGNRVTSEEGTAVSPGSLREHVWEPQEGPGPNAPPAVWLQQDA